MIENSMRSIPDSKKKIRAALLSRGLTVIDFARRYNFNINTVRAVINGYNSDTPLTRNIRSKLHDVTNP